VNRGLEIPMKLLQADEYHCPVQMLDFGLAWHVDEAQKMVPYPPGGLLVGIDSYCIDLDAIFDPLSDDAWT
jgi:hypothetical protein